MVYTKNRKYIYFCLLILLVTAVMFCGSDDDSAAPDVSSTQQTTTITFTQETTTEGNTTTTLSTTIWTPVYVREVSPLSMPQSMFLHEDGGTKHLYLAEGTQNLFQIYDFSDHYSPVYIGSFDSTGSNLIDIVVSGSYAYLLDESEGLFVTDISDLDNITMVGSSAIASMTSCMVKHDNYIFIGSEDLLVFDLTDPVQPALDSTISTDYSVNDLYIDGTSLYVSHGEIITSGSSETRTGKLEMFSLTDPLTMTSSGSFDYNSENSLGQDVVIKNNTAYVLDSYHDVGQMVLKHICKLLVIDVTQPESMSLSGKYEETIHGTDLAVYDDYALITTDTKDIIFIDTSNPDSCYKVGMYDTFGNGMRILLNGTYAYLSIDNITSIYNNQIHILNISGLDYLN